MRSGKQILVRCAILVTVTLFAVLGPRYITVVKVAENWASDLLVTFLTPHAEKHSGIVILKITEETLSQLPYRSPFDREFLADALKVLRSAKVRGVAIDILFDQPTEPAKDAAFIDAAKAMPMPLVVGWTDKASGLSDRQYTFQQTYLDGISAGFSNLFKDPIDSTVRNIFPGREENGRFRPSFAGTLVQALGYQSPRQMIRLAYRGSPAKAGTPTFPAYPIQALNHLPKTWFAGKVVMIGADLPFGDRHRTPFAAGLGAQAGTLSGVYIQAHIVSQLMEGRLQKGSNILFEVVAATVLCLVAILLTFVELSPRIKVTAGVFAFGIFLTIALWLFLDFNLATPVVSPAIAYGAAIGLGSGYEARLQSAQKRQTRDAFSKYLSPAMVEKVADDPEQLQLGGEKREMTLLFCDVRGFTTISEQFDAVGLTSLINQLLTPLTNVILDHQGTVDKYMGDCVMAFWNAPLDDDDHAHNGCLSALGMLEQMGPLNQRLEEEAKQEGRKHIPLRVGLGLNSGECVVGNMGSDQRFDYSVLGDTVNLAARLEGQSKSYGVDIVIGESTEKQVPDLATIELDLIQVKGKTVPVHVFSLIGYEDVAQSESFRKLKAANQAMIDAYRAQDWAKARQHMEDSRRLGEPLGLDGLYDLYAERIEAYQADPPGSGWGGVFIATTK